MTSPSFEGPVGDRYEIGEPLGKGGMSEVFSATDLRLGRPVAIKFLREDIEDPSARARIEAEAKSAAKLSHPNIVNVYDAGEHGQRPYVVMELADARSLADVIREEGPLPADRARSIATQVLAALGAAHAQGIVHRDVKPANILVAEDGGVKLADFGIAKSFSEVAAGLTMAGQVMGTPTYLSPEQAAGQSATPRSDLYALGVVLFETLTGRPPYTGDTPLAVVSAHATAPVPDIREVSPDVPGDLAAAIQRALSKDPAERFASAAEMTAALAYDDATIAAPVMAGATQAYTPTTPLSSPAGGPIPPRARNHFPLIAGVAAAVLFLLLIAFGLSGRGDRNQAAATDTTVPPAPGVAVAAPAAAPTTVPEEQASPDSIEDLLELLEENPEALGEKGPDLRKKIGELFGFEGEKRAKEAAELQQEIAKWVDKGELDSTAGRLAIEYLDQVIAESQQGARRGKGRGRDGEGEVEVDD